MSDEAKSDVTQLEIDTDHDLAIQFKSEEDRSNLIHDILQAGRQIYISRQTWLDEQAENVNLMLGRLAERDFPWPDAPNLGMTDMWRFFRMLLAQYNEVISIRPVANIDPQDDSLDIETARMWEQFLESKITGVMNGRRELRLAAQTMLSRRGCFVKVTYRKEWDWRDTVLDLDEMDPFEEATLRAMTSGAIAEEMAARYEFDPEDKDDAKEIEKAIKQLRAGKRKIVFRRRVKTYDTPVWQVIPGEHVLRDMTGPSDIQQHRLVIHRFWQSLGDIRAKTRGQHPTYDPAVLGKLEHLESHATYRNDMDDFLEQEALANAGILESSQHPQSGDDRMIETWEVYRYYSPNPEETEERKAVFTLFPAAGAPVFARSFYLNRAQWPLKEFEFENIEGKTSTALSPLDMLRDTQVYINTLTNMSLESLLMSYLPVGVYDSNNLEVQQSGALQLQPGLLLPGKVGATLEFMKPASNQRENQFAAQDILGRAELLLGQQQNSLQRTGSSNDPRTKYELQTVNALASRIGSLDIEKFQDAVGDVLWLTIIEIYENMDDEERFRFQRADGTVAEAVVRRKDVEDLRLRIRAHGTLANANKQAEAAKWGMILGKAVQYNQLGVLVDFRQIALSDMAASGIQNLDRILPPPPPQQPGLVPAGVSNAQPSVAPAVPPGTPPVLQIAGAGGPPVGSPVPRVAV